MKPKKRQKLCCNCEGEIDLDVIVCPFCAADLRVEKPEQSRSIYRPLGEGNKFLNSETSQSLYPSAFPKVEAPAEELAIPSEAVESEKGISSEKLSHVIRPTILFTLGIQLFLLGMFILLFSYKGVVVLKWDGRFWFLYVFASVPLLYFGYKSLSKID